MTAFEFIFGYTAIGVIVLAALFWAIVSIPAAALVFKILFLAFWGVATVGAGLFVAVVIDIPNGQYGAAVAAVIAGWLLGLPWVFIGIPELRRTLKNGP